MSLRKEYIETNKKAYDELAEEYATRDYSVQDDFYKTYLFADLGFEKGKRILEIGPGRGARLKNFLSYGMDVAAIELSAEMCKLCSSIAPEAKIINRDVLECQFSEQFDYIYMEAVIHNFPKEEASKVLDAIASWLKDGGIFICTTTADDVDEEGYEKKQDYESDVQRFRHHYTKESFDELISSKFSIVDKKYKKENDEKRNKLWQIVYAKKSLLLSH